MKWQLILMMVLCIGIVYADDGLIETYRPNEVLNLNLHLSNTTGDVSGASCSTRIMLPNYTTIEIIQMNELSGGMYNATYNTSNIGNYFCVQNCTQGTSYTSETCDFIIGGGNKVGALIAIVLILIGVLIYYIYMAKTMNFEVFDDTNIDLGIHNGIKMLLIWGSFWIILIPLNLAMYLTTIYIGSPEIDATLTTFYQFILAANIIISFYILFIIIKRFITKMRA